MRRLYQQGTLVFLCLNTITSTATPNLHSSYSSPAIFPSSNMHYDEHLSDIRDTGAIRYKLSHVELASNTVPCSEFNLGSVVYTPLSSIPKEYGYTAAFSIGTYRCDDGSSECNRVFNLLIDTGSDMLVVTSAEATDSESILVQNRYNCSASLTCSPTQNKLTNSSRWVQRYGDSTLANGTLVQDTLEFIAHGSSSILSVLSDNIPNNSAIGNLKVENQPMLVVDRPGLHLVKSYGKDVDGIIGLNLRSPVIPSTVIESLQKADMIETANGENQLSVGNPSFNSSRGLMSLWLTKSLGSGQGGEILFNAVDRSRFREPIRWSDCGPSPYDWSVPLDRGFLLRDPLTAKYSPVPETDHTFAVIDSGSNGIYLQNSVYNALFQQVPGAKQLSNGYWRVPCEGTMELAIGIEGEVYHIPYEDWVEKPDEAKSGVNATSTRSEEYGMCQARVFGSSPGPTLLGITFLRSVYTVFDYSRPGYERIGFATRV